MTAIPGTVTSITITSSGGTLLVNGDPISTFGVYNIDLPASGVVPGIYYGPFNVNAQGVVTAAANANPVGVTSVGVISNRGSLVVTNSPITSSGNISIDLPIQFGISTPNVTYTNPNVTINETGIITAISNGIPPVDPIAYVYAMGTVSGTFTTTTISVLGLLTTDTIFLTAQNTFVPVQVANQQAGSFQIIASASIISSASINWMVMR